MGRDRSVALWTELTGLAICGALWAVSVTKTQPSAPPPASEPRYQSIEGKYSPIAVYDAKERQLTITDAMPREAFICIRKQCRLAEEWADLGKR